MAASQIYNQCVIQCEGVFGRWGLYVPTDVKVKQMKRPKSDCMTRILAVMDFVVCVCCLVMHLWGFSCDSKMIVWSQSKDCEPVECEDHLDSLSAVICLSECFPSLLGFNFTVAEALMSEFDAENKGDNGDLHTAYTGKGKGDDSESLIKSSIELDTFNSQSIGGHTSSTKSRAAARSDIITRRIKGRKLVVELTNQSGVTIPVGL
ncbi:hypothetical protein DVH24_028695 [Malus domestica]|uniref:Uncharacterized protein n=1 Tax=Malus domestica TaxID=3750 RepID=A0A498IXV4_MALDO|nr:hypothetical protein DVH24_028695 [Malus domestica]